MQLDRKTTLVFQKKILSWYATNRRDLPWRRTRDPYKILVSEVMLQQTQVSRVIPKYEAWLEAFPTLETLAGASRRDILAMWSGLGYNRRALNLQKAAETINELRIKNNELRKKEDKFSYWPKTVEELKKLPGVGAYTARAVACFAFDQQIAVVDTNVRKVILLEVAKGTEEPKGTKEVQKMADELLPKGKASDWNQALMDYAALVLKDKKVPLKKQSRFRESDRYIRGKIVRILLEENDVSFTKLRALLIKDLGDLEEKRLHKIVQDLQSEGFLFIGKTMISIRAQKT